MDRDLLRASIKPHEACRLRVYTDTTGHLTVGWGHNLTDKPISQRAADLILEDDLDDAVSDLERALPWVAELDDVRQRVLAELCFNLGIGSLLAFRATLAAVSRRDFAAAAQHLLASRWAQQVGPSRSGTLARRLETGKD